MPKKIQGCSMAHLVSVPLPNHGTTYTVISHQFVIDYSKTALQNAGFIIIDEEYRCTADGLIAQGIYKLNYNSDPELSMMFAWTNSYNKQVRFKCGVGAYVNKTGTVMVCGDIGSWARKHTGTADTETQDTIDDQVSNAHMYYNQLVADKATMEGINMNKRKQAQMLGILFAEYQILTTEQASMVRQQMDRPLHVFLNADSMWAFYNYVTVALQHSHPKTWMEDQRILHHFISEVNKFAPVSLPTPIINVVPAVFVDPNQTDIVSQLADIEAEEMKEDEIYKAAEEDDLPFPIHIESDQEYLERVADIEGEPEENVTKFEWEEPQVADNQVVQEEVEIEPVVHQSEEIVLTEDELAHQLYGVDNDIEVSIATPENEAEEVPFDIDEDDDSVLGSLLTPCAAHDAETEREIGQENLTSIFPQDETVEYTDPAGNTFEAPIVIDNFQTLEPTPEEHALFEEEEISLWADDDGVDNSLIEPAQDADLSVIEAEDADAFDLNFDGTTSTDSDVDFDF